MKIPATQTSDFVTAAGPRLRCFLRTALLLLLATGFCSATAAYAACPALPEFGVNKIRGAVYGPSGFAVPQIMVQVSREGKLVAQTKTDGKGRFEFKTGPGPYDLKFVFIASESMDLKVRVGRGHGGFFHPARLQVLLGLSGTRCGFATTNSGEFKKALKRFKGQLQERPY